jgi:hypothetical protein
MVYSDNDYSDDEDDYVDDLPDWFLAEEELFTNLSIINKFKKYISKQPTFMAIECMSDVEIMDIINNSNSDFKPKKRHLEDYEIELFDNLYTSLFGSKRTYCEYEAVTFKIIKRCYV